MATKLEPLCTTDFSVLQLSLAASRTLCNLYLTAADLIHPWTVGAYWALPISYVQNAMAINEFTGGERCAGSQCTVVLSRAAPLLRVPV